MRHYDEEAEISRKKRRRKRDLELDEDDYDLLEDNQVTGFRRPKQKKKRLQKAGDREAGGAKTEDDSGPKKPKTVDDLEKELFEVGAGASFLNLA